MSVPDPETGPSPTTQFNRPVDPVSLRELDGWAPLRLYWDQGRAVVDWCCVGDLSPTEPFFDQAIAKAMQQPTRPPLQRQTSTDVLLRFMTFEPRLAPSGFIFHMSRCGSTAISRMLAAMPSNLVVSEAGIMDSVLHAHFQLPGISQVKQRTWLRGLIAALGRASNASQRHFIVKFDSWHVLDLPLIRRTFPSVPWIFVYRQPLEVLASHGRQGENPMTPEAAIRRARVLGRFCEAASQNLDDSGRLVDYREIPAVVWTNVAPHFGIECSDWDIDRLREVGQLDAKNPSVRFVDDSRDKQSEMSDACRAAIDTWAMPHYTVLERQRSAQRDIPVKISKNHA